jgi:hypothetical protein
MTKPFTPFLTDKLSPQGASQTSSTGLPHPLPAGSEPTVTLKRDSDRVTHIIVHCTCGQVVELACEY